MKTSNLLWAFGALLVVALPSAVFAGTGWQGAKIMPKSDLLRMQTEAGGADSGDIYQVAWPATVDKVEGRWLKISDEGGYSSRPSGGWVYCDDVLKLEASRSHYTEELRKQPRAWLYWARGISWESQQEPQLAYSDYQRAVAQRLDNRLDDVEIRLGRLKARAMLRNGKGRYQVGERAQWEQHFQRAERMYQAVYGRQAARPQLHLDWGAALSQACRCSETKDKKTDADADAKAAHEKHGDGEGDSLRSQAMKHYQLAERLNSFWWRAPFARAELLLERCTRQEDDGDVALRSKQPGSDLDDAGIAFGQAISLNPSSPDAYRDRGEVLRLQGRFEEARRLATIACTLTFYRQPKSLRALARVYADMNDYEQALRYATKGSEYASDDEFAQLELMTERYRMKHLELAQKGTPLADNTRGPLGTPGRLDPSRIGARVPNEFRPPLVGAEATAETVEALPVPRPTIIRRPRSAFAE